MMDRWGQNEEGENNRIKQSLCLRGTFFPLWVSGCLIFNACKFRMINQQVKYIHNRSNKSHCDLNGMFKNVKWINKLIDETETIFREKKVNKKGEGELHKPTTKILLPHS